MSKAVLVQKKPYPIDVIEGKSYFWCCCGKSNKQPLCDGSHKNTEFKPVLYKATENKRLYFCGCKRTHKQPLCDGTHNKL